MTWRFCEVLFFFPSCYYIKHSAQRIPVFSCEKFSSRIKWNQLLKVTWKNLIKLLNHLQHKYVTVGTLQNVLSLCVSIKVVYHWAQILCCSIGLLSVLCSFAAKRAIFFLQNFHHCRYRMAALSSWSMCTFFNQCCFTVISFISLSCGYLLIQMILKKCPGHPYYIFLIKIKKYIYI